MTQNCALLISDCADARALAKPPPLRDQPLSSVLDFPDGSTAAERQTYWSHGHARVQADGEKQWSRRPRRRICSEMRSRSTISHALPRATMPATFSVPGRRPRSCPAPAIRGANLVPRLTYSAPVPFGAYSLCPAMVRRSAPSASTSTGCRAFGRHPYEPPRLSFLQAARCPQSVGGFRFRCSRA